jgi:putative hemolysin
MDISTSMQFIILIILLLLSSFFSASETALMSLSKIKVRHMAKENVKGSELLMRLIKNPSKILGAILIGNNIVNIAASALATSLSIKYFGSSGVGVATGIMTVLVLIFGEITPKSIAAANAEKISLKIARPLSFIKMLLTPLTYILTHLTSAIIRILGGEKNKSSPFITEEEFRTMVDVGHEEGVLETGEKELIHNVFEFTDLQVRDVMTQRLDIASMDRTLSYDEISDIFKHEKYSRLLVYESNIDNPVGILHVKDLIYYARENEPFDINKYMRKPFFTYEYKSIAKLFSEMRKNRVSIAVVLDEYGGTAGIVTIEDLVEEIVGDISDEFDEHLKHITKVSENQFLILGSTKLDEVNETLGINIESRDFETIGGFIIGEVGRLPQRGEILEYSNMKFVVEQVQKNRITSLKLFI